MSNISQAPAFFAVIPAPVLNDDKLSDAAKILYARISTLTQKSGYCWSSNETLAKISNSSTRTISRLLSLLQECGHILIQIIPANRKGGRERRIFLGGPFTPPAPTSADTPEEPQTDAPSAPEAPEPSDAPGLAASGVDKNGMCGQKWRDPSSQKWRDPNIMYDNKKKINNPLTPLVCLERITEYAGEDRELETAIRELVANRAEALGPKKAVRTLRTMNGILRDLDRHSDGDRAQKLLMLDNAIKNNWLTVYRLKEDELPKPKRKSTRIVEEEGVRYW